METLTRLARWLLQEFDDFWHSPAPAILAATALILIVAFHPCCCH